MSNETKAVSAAQQAEAAEKAHQAWAAVALALENKKGTKRLHKAAQNTSDEARALLEDFDTPPNGTVEEAEGIAEAWAAVWADASEDDEDEISRAMSKTLDRYKPGYKPTVTHKGTKSLNNGDDVATALTAMEPEDVVKLAEKLLGLEAGELATKYERLNPGQKRMNSGNRIRGAIRRGDLTAEEVVAATKS